MRYPGKWFSVSSSTAIVLLSVGLCAVPARADDAVDEQKINALFAEARDAFVAGDYGTACPKFEEVVRQKPGLGARIGLGDCYRAQQRRAKAWEVYKGVVNDVPDLVKRAKGFTEQSKVRKRGEEAQARIKEMEPYLGWVLLMVPESVLGLQDLVIHLDGAVLDRTKLGIRLPVDRGEHIVDVSAAGKKTWGKTVALVEGADLSVTIEPLEDDVPPVKPVPIEPPHVKTGTETKPSAGKLPSIGGDSTLPPKVGPLRPDTKDEYLSQQRVFGITLGAVGIGAALAGAAFGIRAVQKRSESEAGGHCVANRCDDIGLPLRQASYNAGNASTGLLIGGGVALAAGAALFLTAPKHALPVQATIVLGPSSIQCIGRF
jgi:hypothetical protein